MVGMTYHRALTAAQWWGIMGTAIAASISWSENQSILWATLHSFLGWIYVLYYALTN
jgi:hypothetical protein